MKFDKFPQSFQNEFESVDILLQNDFKTAKTDAFIITHVKVEKQVRRLFTYLVYQFSNFSLQDYSDILNTVKSKKYLYFMNFIKGFDALYPSRFRDVTGQQLFDNFVGSDFVRIKDYRDKILHGQPTGKKLNESQLKNEVIIMRTWCYEVAQKMYSEIGFDGFMWNSFRKSLKRDFASKFKVSIKDINDLSSFMDKYMKKKAEAHRES